MATSQIKITFNQDLALNDVVNFRRKFDNGSLSGFWELVSETWKVSRQSIGQVAIGTPTATPGERSAINFAQAITLDYFGLIGVNGFAITRSANVVTITSSIYWSYDLNSLPVANPASVNIEISNFNLAIFYITNTAFSEATVNPVCTHYKVSVTTSELATNITSPISVTGNTNNPFTFEIPRGQGFNIACSNANGQSITQSILFFYVPGIFNTAGLNVNVSNSPNGATVTGTILTNPNNNPLKYSLDNNTWQSSNVFTGLAEGNYTMYVKDAYGCVASSVFTVDDNNVNNPFSYISKSNSIRFAEQVTFGSCGPYKNDENTLSHQAYAIDPNLAYPEYQKFNSCDTITNQLLSNYSNIVVKVLKANGTEDTITTTQLTSNIGRKDSRDAIKYDLGDGQTGIYFTTGNIYDYDTNIDTGEDYALNGGLPEWGKKGNYFSINNAWFQIETTIYDETLQAEILVINAVYTGVSPANIITKAIFNRQNYEVHEFTIPMVAYNDTIIQVKIEETDDRFPDKNRLSEYLCIKTSHKNTSEVISYSVDNNDVFYTSGIKHKVRLPIIRIEGDHEEDSEINKGDDASGMVSSSLHEVNKFEFGPVTKEIYRMITAQLSNEIVIIDGVYYIKNGGIEKEGPLEESNLYLVKATMLKSRAGYRIDNQEELISIDENLEVPNLVITGDGKFISYQ